MDYLFDWDAGKALSNQKKHRVSFEEASTVFRDPLARIWFDEDHAEAEDRYLVVGFSARQRPVIVSFLLRDPGQIRIISARNATRKEVRRHEEDEDYSGRGR